MKYFTLLLALPLLACQPADTDTDLPLEEETAPSAPEQTVSQDGKVRVVLQPPVAEPRACIIPIRIENGLEDDVSVTMIGFDVTGPGDDTQGNMFAPSAEPGMTSEARVILQGQSCDAFDTLTVPEVLCKAAEEDCSDLVEFEDGGGLRFSQAG